MHKSKITGNKLKGVSTSTKRSN